MRNYKPLTDCIPCWCGRTVLNSLLKPAVKTASCCLKGILGDTVQFSCLNIRINISAHIAFLTANKTEGAFKQQMFAAASPTLWPPCSAFWIGSSRVQHLHQGLQPPSVPPPQPVRHRLLLSTQCHLITQINRAGHSLKWGSGFQYGMINIARVLSAPVTEKHSLVFIF